MYATDLAAFNPFSATQESSNGAFDARPQADIFATSLHDFVNPAASTSSPQATSYSSSQGNYHAPSSRPFEQQRPRPTKTVSWASTAASTSQTGGNASIALSEFWAHPVSSCTHSPPFYTSTL
jgi:hypothetical protein